MPQMTHHLKGLLITATGVVVISPDGLLTRLIEVDHWTLLFWRGFLLAFGMWVLTGYMHPNRTWRAYRRIGSHGALMVFTFTLATISFINAITHTSVANTLILLSTTPLFAALIGFVAWREAIGPRTWVAIGLVAAGVYVIGSDTASQATSLFGDIAAMSGAFFLAAGFVVVRRRPAISVFPVISISGMLTALLVLPLADPLSVSQRDLGYLILMGVYLLPVGTAMMYIGPKYIPAPEVGLMLLLESVLGPVWVWMVLEERPGLRTFIGGAIILSTLALNALWAMRSIRPRGPSPGD